MEEIQKPSQKVNPLLVGTLAVVVIVVLICAGVYFYVKTTNKGTVNNTTSSTSSSSSIISSTSSSLAMSSTNSSDISSLSSSSASSTVAAYTTFNNGYVSFDYPSDVVITALSEGNDPANASLSYTGFIGVKFKSDDITFEYNLSTGRGSGIATFDKTTKELTQIPEGETTGTVTKVGYWQRNYLASGGIIMYLELANGQKNLYFKQTPGDLDTYPDIANDLAGLANNFKPFYWKGSAYGETHASYTTSSSAAYAGVVTINNIDRTKVSRFIEIWNKFTTTYKKLK